MKLSLINEAGMSRRGFLKLLGKSALAVSSGPDIFGFLGDLLMPQYLKFIDAYRNSGVSNGDIEEAINTAFNWHGPGPAKFIYWVTKPSKNPLSPTASTYQEETIDPNVVKGFILNKTLKDNDLSYWVGGDNPEAANQALNGLLGKVFETVVKRIGPKGAMKQMIDVHDYDTAMYGMHELMNFSKTFRNFMSEMGVTSNAQWEKLRFRPEGVDFLEKLDVIDPEEAKIVRSKLEEDDFSHGNN